MRASSINEFLNYKVQLTIQVHAKKFFLKIFVVMTLGLLENSNLFLRIERI